MLAAVWGRYETVIEDGAPEPPLPRSPGNAYCAELPAHSGRLESAIDAFEKLEEVKRIFAPKWCRIPYLTKRQELHYNARTDPAKSRSNLSGHGVNQMALMKIGILPDRPLPRNNMKTRLAINGDMFRQTAGGMISMS